MFGFVMIMTCEGGRTNRQGFKTDLRSQNRQGFKTDLVSKGVGAEEDLSLSRDKMLFCGQRGQEGKTQERKLEFCIFYVSNAVIKHGSLRP